MVEWTEDGARRVVHRVVERNVGLFAAFRDLEFEDLMSIGMDAARDSLRGYVKEKGGLSTWIYRAARSKLIDVWRSRSAEAKRETLLLSSRPMMPAGDGVTVIPVSVDPGTPGEGEGEELSDVEWLSRVVRRARREHGTAQVRRGRKWYSPAVAVAVLALKARKKMSFGQLAMFLADRPDLRKVLGILHKPSLPTLKRFVKKVEDSGIKFQQGAAPTPRTVLVSRLRCACCRKKLPPERFGVGQPKVKLCGPCTAAAMRQDATLGGLATNNGGNGQETQIPSVVACGTWDRRR